MAERKPIISFRNFSFQYRAQKRPTLTDIDLEIYPGERVLIAGPSGSGKSTLAGCINGLNPFSNPGACTGTLTVDGVDAPHSSIFELSAHVGTVLQDPDGQFIGLTVGEDIAFALANIVAHLLAWILVAPVLDIAIYAEPVKKVFAQGAFAAVSNSITAVVVGGLLVLAYTKTIAKKGSLDKE